MPERDSINSIDDPKHWRERAEEARTTAGNINDPASKKAMLRLAQDYDRRAEYVRIRAEVRAWSKVRQERRTPQPIQNQDQDQVNQRAPPGPALWKTGE